MPLFYSNVPIRSYGSFLCGSVAVVASSIFVVAMLVLLHSAVFLFPASNLIA